MPTKTPPFAVLVANGPLPDTIRERLLADASACDLLIGVDGGARHLRRLGLRPDVITGDFDSLSPEEQAEFAAEGVTLVPTPDQDYTDLDKALAYAREIRGASRVWIHAATGGRLDHLYSVLSAVVKYGRRGDIRLVDEIGETWLAQPRQTLFGSDLPGRTLSLMALGPVEGVTLSGVRWPLNGESLAPGVRDGTLNEILSPAVTLKVGAGDLLILLHHPFAG